MHNTGLRKTDWRPGFFFFQGVKNSIRQFGLVGQSWNLNAMAILFARFLVRFVGKKVLDAFEGPVLVFVLPVVSFRHLAFGPVQMDVRFLDRCGKGVGFALLFRHDGCRRQHRFRIKRTQKPRNRFKRVRAFLDVP